MSAISSLTNRCESLLLDASVVVNLNASGFADRVLTALPMSVGISGHVVSELKRGELAGYSDATDLQRLLDAEVVEVIPLGGAAHSDYISLVSGSTAASLDDGEAATIATGNAIGAFVAIDEKKGRRICKERFSSVGLVSTVDLFLHDSVRSNLSASEMSNAVTAALEVANMQVHPEHIDWVVDQVTPGRLSNCLSLPRAVRVKGFGAKK